jgi:hypothetical protein
MASWRRVAAMSTSVSDSRHSWLSAPCQSRPFEGHPGHSVLAPGAADSARVVSATI